MSSEAADDAGNYSVGPCAMLDSPGRGNIECSPAESGGIGADDETDVDRRRAAVRRCIVADVEDVDPVVRRGSAVVEEAPCPVWRLVQFGGAEERLPGIPNGLREREHAPCGSVAAGDLEFDRDLLALFTHASRTD